MDTITFKDRDDALAYYCRNYPQFDRWQLEVMLDFDQKGGIERVLRDEIIQENPEKYSKYSKTKMKKLVEKRMKERREKYDDQPPSEIKGTDITVKGCDVIKRGDEEYFTRCMEHNIRKCPKCSPPMPLELKQALELEDAKEVKKESHLKVIQE